MTHAACDHKFVLLDSAFRTEAGGYNTHYTRVDTFYCERCLEYNDVKRDEWARERPIWWKQ